MASSGAMDMDVKYSEDQSCVSPTSKGKKDKGKKAAKSAYELQEFSHIRKQLIDMRNSSGHMKQSPATAVIANAIRNLTVLIQNLSASFQEHLAGIGRKKKGEAGPRPSMKKLSEDKTKSYKEAAAGKDPETPPRKDKKNKGKRKAE
ncbi:hypothetical protein HOY80DRAFT_1053875 [Tuber brumale]|nr:hypothetical protein HOY80DRAFT_1053875 [Tuber brumale]